MAGVALCIGSSISWTVGSWLQGRLPLPGDIFTIAAYQQVIAACCSATMAVATGEHFSMNYSKAGWFAMAHLVFSCSIAGFLACHVLTCRFLVQEGIVDRERFTAFLEDALTQMTPDIKDHRSLFGLQQIISSLRSPPPEEPSASADTPAQR